MSGYKFSVDFSADNCVYDNLIYITNKYGAPRKMIEIGVYEGRTSFWFSDLVNQYADMLIYLIDPHEGSNDLTDVSFSEIKANFDYNLSVHKYNVKYIQKNSTYGLLDLIKQNEKVDLVYIDGDHRASQVLTDLVLSWQLINIGGMILCDDSTNWKHKDANGYAAVQMSPRIAVESFINCNWDKLQIVKLPNSAQTAFIKVNE